MPCKHKDCTLTVELRGVNKYHVVDIDGPVGKRTSTRPVRMTVDAQCEGCGFFCRYNASAKARTADLWPVWLLNHLGALCEVDESLRRACIACHVPGIKES